MITTEKVIMLLRGSKIDTTEHPVSRNLIAKYRDQLIEDTDYITQMLVQAHNATNSDFEAMEFIMNDYIKTNIKTEIMMILDELETDLKTVSVS